MPFVTVREMLLDARTGGYAIGAFNAENMEMAQAIIEAAEDLHAPVIVQTTSGTLKYAPPRCFAGMVSRMAKHASVPVALHLDHGNGYAIVEKCLREGYSSVMIDGSLLPYEENVALTRSVVSAAGDIPVEAELGTVGGKEDGHQAQAQYTDPATAADFVKRTGVSSFAMAIGTAHGVYKGTPKLDLERLEEISKMVSVPLVLHGTSGVPHDQVRACIALGVCKVNYATELRIAFTQGVKQAMAEKPDAFDPKQYLAAGREAVFALVRDRIRLCGSEGKA